MIRPGRDDDGAAFERLIGVCWREYGDLSEVRGEIPDIDKFATATAAAGGALWSAMASGQVVGMVVTTPAEHCWHLSRMYVAKAQRGSGLAVDLLLTAENHVRRSGGTCMVLWSDVLFTRAHRFYEKHGYLRRGGVRTADNPAQSIEAGFSKLLVTH